MALVVTSRQGKISLLRTGMVIPVEGGGVRMIQAWSEELEQMQNWLPDMDWHVKKGAAYSTGTVTDAMAQMAAIFWNHNTNMKRIDEFVEGLKEEEEDD